MRKPTDDNEIESGMGKFSFLIFNIVKFYKYFTEPAHNSVLNNYCNCFFRQRNLFFRILFSICLLCILNRNGHFNSDLKSESCSQCH